MPSAEPSRRPPLGGFRYPSRIVGAAAIGLAISYAVATWRPVPGWELSITEWINDAPDITASALYPIMQLGTLAGPAIVAVAIAVFRRDWLLSIATIVVGIVTWFTAKGVKRVVERGRPASYMPEIIIREGDGAGLGYVSGHSAVAAATAVMAMAALPRALATCSRGCRIPGRARSRGPRRAPSGRPRRRLEHRRADRPRRIVDRRSGRRPHHGTWGGPGMTDRMVTDRRTWAIVLAIAVVIAVVAGLVASPGGVPGWEQSIFHAINDLPDWLEKPMWVFQLAGLLFVPLIVAAVAAAFKQWWLAIALVVFVPLKLLVEKGVVKQLVERQRPGTTICGYDAA